MKQFRDELNTTKKLSFPHILNFLFKKCSIFVLRTRVKRRKRKKFLNHLEGVFYICRYLCKISHFFSFLCHHFSLSPNSLVSVSVLGWVNMYQIYHFSTRQAHLPPKVPKQTNLYRSLQKQQVILELCVNFFAQHCDKKLYKIEIHFFAVRFQC